ncbi:MAG TPA: Rne/Rng family ribonuclease [Bryobacteraceae bacterium]|nr:Rne/Rng family ribonuclease [Bryobacteraceae bacterium]
MSKELVISSNRHETKVAVLEDDQVVEVYFQRENEYSLAGSIHKGRVTRVLPGMQSAFVDIGLDRDAFLYVSDFFEDNEEYDKIVSSVEEKILRLEKGGPAAAAAAPLTVEVPPAVKPAEVPEVPVAPPPPALEVRQPDREAREREARDRDGRDRRGRRSRRRRPNNSKGPRIPESKYYTPNREEAPAQEEPEAAEPDDFFVLPGESLAKYSHGEQDRETDEEVDADEPIEAAAPDGVETAEEPAVEEDNAGQPEVRLSPDSETAAEIGIAAPENMDLPGAVPEDGDNAVEEESGEKEPLPAGEPAVEEAEAEEEPPALTADEDEEVAQDVEPAVLAAAAEVMASSEDVDPGESSGEPSGDEQSEPEPARIITSLTATLREQGPRYLHRVSRRMRRKGGRGGEAPESRAPEQQAPPQQRTPPRQEQQRTASRPETAREKGAAPSIADLLREGQEIIVQIAKEPLGQKGARITSHIALPGRFLVYMPTVDHIGVSRKIASDEERARLKRILQSHRAGIPGGYIVRTAGEGHPEEELRADMMFLYNLWLDMRQKAEKRPAPALIHHDLDVVERTLRDQLTQVFKSIWVDSEEVYENVLRFVQRFQPALVGRVKLYTRPTPIFDEFAVTSELEKALRPKVWLKSGGYIVINQTEALVAIDVNTGKYVGKSNRLEDTIVKTNTDAIREIVRQIRLRDLGGIIVVDFIDMDERKNRQKVMQVLEEAMRSDRAPYKILQFNDFGLVAITRKRVKQSLERSLCSPCPYCEGAGYVKSVGTVISEILVEAQKIARAVEGEDVMLRVNPEVAKFLKSSQNNYLQEIEEILGRTVLVKSDPQLHQEKFDLA